MNDEKLAELFSELFDINDEISRVDSFKLFQYKFFDFFKIIQIWVVASEVELLADGITNVEKLLVGILESSK